VTTGLEAVGRGRPATTVEGLRASLTRARSVNVGLRLELKVERQEHRAFAERVLAGAQDIHRAIPAGQTRRIELKALELAYQADRRIRQTGGIL